MDEKKTRKTSPQGGVAAAAELVAGLDPDAQARILAEIARRDPKLAVEIEKLVLRFEDLAVLDSREMQALISSVPAPRLALALREASPGLRAAFEGGMSKRAAEMLKEDMDASGPKPVAEVRAAQSEILSKARELESQGRLVLKRR